MILISLLNFSCQNDKITIADGIQYPLVKCGNEKTDLFFQSCASSINISVVTGSTSSTLYKGSKLYYEGKFVYKRLFLLLSKCLINA